MSPLILWHIGGGGLLLGSLIGVGGLVFALTGRTPRWSRIAILVGILLVGSSATPSPPVLQIALAVLVVASLVVTGLRDRPRLQRSLLGTTVGAWVLLVVIELPWHLSQRLPSGPGEQLFVVGDSISAGVDEGEVTWPGRLPLGPSRVHDFSHVGATVGSAIEQAKQIDGPGVVVLEIGGNDVLGSTTVPDFERDLDALLASVTGEDRSVVMFELPVPPTYERFARVQRRLARRHGVEMIPRRALLYVLTTGGATLDSIHLTQRGHDAMARVVWDVVESAFDRTGRESGHPL